MKKIVGVIAALAIAVTGGVAVYATVYDQVIEPNTWTTNDQVGEMVIARLWVNQETRAVPAEVTLSTYRPDLSRSSVAVQWMGIHHYNDLFGHPVDGGHWALKARMTASCVTQGVPSANLKLRLWNVEDEETNVEVTDIIPSFWSDDYTPEHTVEVLLTDEPGTETTLPGEPMTLSMDLAKTGVGECNVIGPVELIAYHK